MTRTAISILIGSALVLAACGGDDESADTTVPVTTAAPTTAVPPTTAAPTTVAPTTAAPTTAAPTTAAPETTVPENTVPEGETISDLATVNGATFIPTYTQFAPNYAAAIEGPGPVTALMPDDEAFIGFTTTYPNLTEELRADFDLLDTVLTYHVLDGAMTAAEIMAVTELPTLQGEPISVEVVGDAVVFNGGEGSVKIADLVAANGIVQILDGILLPPSIAASAD